MSDLAQIISQLGAQARAAARTLAGTPPAQIDAALLAMADAVLAAQAEILAANAADVADAVQAGRAAALVDRLTLNPSRLAACAAGLRAVAALPHPVG